MFLPKCPLKPYLSHANYNKRGAVNGNGKEGRGDGSSGRGRGVSLVTIFK